MTEAEISELGDVKASRAVKTSRRDLAYVVANQLNGGTTVSGTLIIANLAGILIFATGGKLFRFIRIWNFRTIHNFPYYLYFEDYIRTRHNTFSRYKTWRICGNETISPARFYSISSSSKLLELTRWRKRAFVPETGIYWRLRA